MSDRDETVRMDPDEPKCGMASDEGHNAHPVDPAEGPREPDDNANAPRPPHSEKPAEGDR